MQYNSGMWTTCQTEKQTLHSVAFTNAVRNNQHCKHYMLNILYVSNELSA